MTSTTAFPGWAPSVPAILRNPAGVTPLVLADAAWFRVVLEPLLLSLTAGLARAQPHAPGAFVRAALTGAPYTGGGAHADDEFDAAAASAYMSFVGGPLLHALFVRAASASPRPATRAAAAELIAGAAEAAAAQLDDAAARISAGLKGFVARKRVGAMRADPANAARAAKAAAHGAYAPGAVSRRGHAGAPPPPLPVAAAGAGGAGVEAAAHMSDAAFHQMLSEQLGDDTHAAAVKVQALARRNAAKAEAQRILEERRADPAVVERAAKAREGYATTKARSPPAAPARRPAETDADAAAAKVQALARRNAAKGVLAARRADADVVARAAKARESYSTTRAPRTRGAGAAAAAPAAPAAPAAARETGDPDAAALKLQALARRNAAHADAQRVLAERRADSEIAARAAIAREKYTVVRAPRARAPAPAAPAPAGGPDAADANSAAAKVQALARRNAAKADAQRVLEERRADPAVVERAAQARERYVTTKAGRGGAGEGGAAVE